MLSSWRDTANKGHMQVIISSRSLHLYHNINILNQMSSTVYCTTKISQKNCYRNRVKYSLVEYVWFVILKIIYELSNLVGYSSLSAHTQSTESLRKHSYILYSLKSKPLWSSSSMGLKLMVIHNSNVGASLVLSSQYYNSSLMFALMLLKLPIHFTKLFFCLTK